MGGGSAQTVGYKYYLGMHMVLSHGPIDHISTIYVDDRIAWEGFAAGGQISINKEGLFGGEEREGGIVGSVDIEMGEDTQLQNDYLQAQLQTDIPAYRGVVSAILRQVYLGLNPYIKKWAFRAQRIYATTSGEEQWYPGTAPIGYIEGNVALYFALDYSGSMSIIEPGNGLSRLANMKTAVTNALAPLQGIPDNSPIDIKVVGFGQEILSIERFGCSGQDISDIIDWIDIRDYPDFTTGQTDFGKAFAPIEAFFNATGSKDRVSIVITDGEPAASYRGQTAQENIDEAAAYLWTVSNITAYGFNIDLEDTYYTEFLDNTPADGVPVVAGGDDSALTDVLAGILYSHLDMNPAHIIRECLTDAEWGMGYPEADMDDTSFTLVADQLLNEAMGISLLWDKQMPIEEFIQEIARHINATLYVDRITGLFTLKLIRDDYDEGTLLELDPTNISKLSDYNRQDPGEAINSVTVVYWDHATGQNGTVTADDIALIQAYGTVINTTVQYPGFTNGTIAGKTAARDLKTFSSPLLNCTIEANREASGLNIGDVFKLVWPDYHTGYVVMRVQQIAFGGPGNNKVKINASEDIFALPDAVIIGTEEPGWEDVQVDPTAVPIQISQELPYYGMVLALTQLDADVILADNNDVGYWVASAGRSTGAINAQVHIDDTSGYVDSALLDFAPYGQLSAELSKFGTTLTLTGFEDLDEIVLGTMAQIDNEIVRVDAVDTVTGDITIGRGVLDTIPVIHLSGAYLLFTDENIASDGTEYVATEVLNVKVLPSTSNGTLPLASATADIITMASRAFSPFRPANFRAATFIDPLDTWFPVYPVLLEWDQRNRLLETGGAFLAWEDGAVAEEASATYEIVIDAYEEDKSTLISNITTVTGLTGSSYSLTDVTLDIYSGSPFIRVAIIARRDGYPSIQSPELFFRGSFKAPTDLAGYFIPEAAPTITEAIVKA